MRHLLLLALLVTGCAKVKRAEDSSLTDARASVETTRKWILTHLKTMAAPPSCSYDHCGDGTFVCDQLRQITAKPGRAVLLGGAVPLPALIRRLEENPFVVVGDEGATSIDGNPHDGLVTGGKAHLLASRVRGKTRADLAALLLHEVRHLDGMSDTGNVVIEGESVWSQEVIDGQAACLVASAHEAEGIGRTVGEPLPGRKLLYEYIGGATTPTLFRHEAPIRVLDGRVVTHIELPASHQFGLYFRNYWIHVTRENEELKFFVRGANHLHATAFVAASRELNELSLELEGSHLTATVNGVVAEFDDTHFQSEGTVFVVGTRVRVEDYRVESLLPR